MYFESHAHYDDNRFKKDLDDTIKKIEESGVSCVINAGANMKSSKKGIELSEKYKIIYAAVGIHPHDADKIIEADLDLLREYSKNEKVVAIGEIGLDFFYDNSPRDIQEYWFKKQLDLANELMLPVIIHSREADEKCYEIIKQADIKKRGVIHCFSGSKELAIKYTKMGYYIGVGGVVTYSNARKLLEVVENISIENILIETDSPYLSPVPNRGKRNDSSNLKYVVDKIAKLKNMSNIDVQKVTFENAVKLYLN